MHRATYTLFNICLILILTVGLTVLVVDKRPDKGPLSVFDYQLMVVVSGSMEPNIAIGSIIGVKQVDAGKVSRGKVITFTPRDNANVYVTHRVVAVNPDGSLATKGDANITRDRFNVLPSDIVGQVNFVIPYLGYAVLAARSKLGLAVIATIILTLLVIEMFELFKWYVPQRSHITIGGKNGRRRD